MNIRSVQELAWDNKKAKGPRGSHQLRAAAADRRVLPGYRGGNGLCGASGTPGLPGSSG